MREFFYPDSVAVFGVADTPRNLARNIISNCLGMGFKGELYPVGRDTGSVYGKAIIADAESLPTGIELAVILVPAAAVAETLDLCGRKGIRHAVISTGGYSEFEDENNQNERDLINVADKYGIRFIGPNCIGVMCTNSGLCTPFAPYDSGNFKKGRTSIIAQSGGVTGQCGHYFSDEHLGFSKIISAGNKLNLDEIDFIKYLMDDDDTDQIHLYLESIEHGRELMRLAKMSKKPIVIYKSNTSRTASEIAKSHTAALSNNDLVVDGALRQSGIVRARDIHDMTVCAKALRLPPLRGDRLAAISFSGGFSVILGDACEAYGFQCPALPQSLLSQIESFRRAGVIRMSNPMDFGDVHDKKALAFAIESCLELEEIDGLAISMLYGPQIAKVFWDGVDFRGLMLDFLMDLSKKNDKPISLSFFTERQYIEDFKKMDSLPVFNDPVESIRALRISRDYWRRRITGGKNEDNSRCVTTGEINAL